MRMILFQTVVAAGLMLLVACAEPTGVIASDSQPERGHLQLPMALQELNPILPYLPPVLAKLSGVVSGMDVDRKSLLACVRNDSSTFTCRVGDGSFLVHQSDSIEDFGFELEFIDSIDAGREFILQIRLTPIESGRVDVSFTLTNAPGGDKMLSVFRDFAPLWKAASESPEDFVIMMRLVYETVLAQEGNKLRDDHIDTLRTELGETSGLMGTDFRRSYTLGFVVLAAFISGFLGYVVRDYVARRKNGRS